MEQYEEILQRMEETYEQASGSKVKRRVGNRTAAPGFGRGAVPAGDLHGLVGTSGLSPDGHRCPAGSARSFAGSSPEASGKGQGSCVLFRYLPISFDLVVPKGTVCATSGEPVVEYETTEEVILKAGTLTIDAPVEAVTPGAAGNAAAGYVTTLVSPPTGINYAANKEAITGGRDAEEDEAYRARILESYSLSSNGANGDYYRKMALEQEGITSVEVVPRSGGAGTVTLYVWGEGTAPSSQVISDLKEKLNEARELGVTVTVEAATQVPMNVHMEIQPSDGVDFDWAKEQVVQAVQAYGKTRQVGEAFYLADITKAALNAAPLVKVTYPDTMMDIEAISGYMITLDTINVEAIS